MKERFTNVAQKTLDVFVKFASTKAITALKDGFVLSMPITLVGSIFLLIANLPITGYTDFMARIFGSDWNLGLNQINNSTFNVLAMVIAVGIGYSYARNEKMDGISCGILTLVSFLIVSPSTLTVTSDTIKALGGDTATISNVLPNTWMGGNGIISAIIMGLIGSWVYTTCIKKNLRIKMPDAVPEGVSNAFSAMIPGFFIMCYSAIIYSVPGLRRRFADRAHLQDHPDPDAGPDRQLGRCHHHRAAHVAAVLVRSARSEHRLRHHLPGAHRQLAGQPEPHGPGHQATQPTAATIWCRSSSTASASSAASA